MCAHTSRKKLYLLLERQTPFTRAYKPSSVRFLPPTTAEHAISPKRGWKDAACSFEGRVGRRTLLPNFHRTNHAQPRDPSHTAEINVRRCTWDILRKYADSHRHISALDHAREGHGSSSDFRPSFVFESLYLVAAMEDPILLLLGNLLLLRRVGSRPRNTGDREGNGKDPLDELHRRPRANLYAATCSLPWLCQDANNQR